MRGGVTTSFTLLFAVLPPPPRDTEMTLPSDNFHDAHDESYIRQSLAGGPGYIRHPVSIIAGIGIKGFGEVIPLDGSLSYHQDPEVDPGSLVYLWEFVEGTGTIADPTQAVTTATVPVVGKYTIRLTVTDATGLTGASLVSFNVYRTQYGSVSPSITAGVSTEPSLLINPGSLQAGVGVESERFPSLEIMVNKTTLQAGMTSVLKGERLLDGVVSEDITTYTSSRFGFVRDAQASDFAVPVSLPVAEAKIVAETYIAVGSYRTRQDPRNPLTRPLRSYRYDGSLGPVFHEDVDTSGNYGSEYISAKYNPEGHLYVIQAMDPDDPIFPHDNDPTKISPRIVKYDRGGTLLAKAGYGHDRPHLNYLSALTLDSESNVYVFIKHHTDGWRGMKFDSDLNVISETFITEFPQNALMTVDVRIAYDPVRDKDVLIARFDALNRSASILYRYDLTTGAVDNVDNFPVTLPYYQLNSIANGLDTHPDGSIVCHGYTGSALDGTKSEEVYKISPDGTVVWTSVINNPGTTVQGVSFSPDGSIFVGVTTQDNRTQPTIEMLKLDSSGQQVTTGGWPFKRPLKGGPNPVNMRASSWPVNTRIGADGRIYHTRGYKNPYDNAAYSEVLCISPEGIVLWLLRPS